MTTGALQQNLVFRFQSRATKQALEADSFQIIEANMEKHYNGKHIVRNVIHNGISFRMIVVKGSSSDHIPEDPEDKSIGKTIHMSLARTKKEFDENLIEVLNVIQSEERVISICSNDVTYEYGYTRLKEMPS